MANSTEARTTTGEIIDQGAKAPNVAVNTTAVAGAPEAYAEFKSTDGTIIDAADALPIFKELNLPQEAAQKLIDLYAKQTSATRDSAMAAVEKMRSDWVGEIKADSDLGPVLETKVLPEIAKLKNALPADLRESFNDAMNFTGAGDHPAVIRALYKIASLVNEGSHVSGQAPSAHGQTKSGQSSRPTLAGAMYPNLPQ